MPRNRAGSLVFWCRNSLVVRPLFPEICAQSDPPAFKQHNFDKYPLIARQLSELAKKVQLAQIGSRPCALQQAIHEPCTLPLSPPKGGTKRDFVIFYPRGADFARVIAIIVCPSVRLSVCVSVCLCVTRWYFIKTAKCRITQTTVRDSLGTLTPRVVGGRPPFPWNLRSKWPTPFQQVAQLSLTNQRDALYHDKRQNFKTVMWP